MPREYIGRNYSCRIYDTFGAYTQITRDNIHDFIFDIIDTVNHNTHPLQPLDELLMEITHDMNLVAGAVNEGMDRFMDMERKQGEDQFKKTTNFMTHIHIPNHRVYDGAYMGD